MKSSGTVALTALLAIHVAGVAYGQADFEGIWTPDNPPGLGQPALDEVPLTPPGRAELEAFGAEDDPVFRCIMPGIPRGFTDPYPLEIIQQDHQIVLLYEYFHQVRRIYMDGREAPEFWPPSLAGYSTGSWDGETLVVRTTSLSPDTYMDQRGLPFSGAEDTYVVERYTRLEDELNLAVEVHDPTNYEEPYTMKRSWNFTPDAEIWEYECNPEFGNVR